MRLMLQNLHVAQHLYNRNKRRPNRWSTMANFTRTFHCITWANFHACDFQAISSNCCDPNAIWDVRNSIWSPLTFITLTSKKIKLYATLSKLHFKVQHHYCSQIKLLQHQLTLCTVRSETQSLYKAVDIALQVNGVFFRNSVNEKILPSVFI